ncbi:hypothetical protein JTE90_005863 [Oedothorax gibbosus]|uniref:Peptidase S1 domain-containing protein n=1 Tax=Oedothorax gibbosus TaxID=931172 RepID=A0AAV6USN4_9ARAC|nr:hypothetical protein JTE90_005863 [Oedothorax gibbosus]
MQISEENDATKERIIDGYPVSQGKFPWMVAVQIYDNNDDQNYSFCSGFIADNRTIVTAGHCTHSGKKTFTVIVGSVDRVKGTEIKIKSGVSHPDFANNGVGHHDVAVLITEEDISFNRDAKDICIEEKESSHVGANVKIMGWGKTSKSDCVSPIGESSDKLLYRQQKVDSEEKEFIYTKSNETRPCEGDSGSPLVYQGSHNNTPIAIGVLSGGTSLSMDAFTRLSTNVNFIKQHAKHARFC